MENYNSYDATENNDGSLADEEYFLNGKLHRLDGPAGIIYIGGKIWVEQYCINGRLHRIDGPAYITYDRVGLVCGTDFYLCGQQVSEKEFNTPGFVDAFILEHS